MEKELLHKFPFSGIFTHLFSLVIRGIYDINISKQTICLRDKDRGIGNDSNGRLIYAYFSSIKTDRLY